ncbi:MAG: hypothetical protein ACRETZ_08580 [Steroidobacteraceae bacterium]
MPALNAWDSFYVIVGSAAGALIGLQFVVLTLIAVRPSQRSAEAGAAFATPTIVHFSSALLLSALLRAPWATVEVPGILWGVVGVLGVLYTAVVLRRMRVQSVYRPVMEDWVFHFLLPLTAYVVLVAATPANFLLSRDALFGVGGATLLLLFVGIHNAWDATAYHVFVSLPKAARKAGGQDEDSHDARR